MQLGWEWSDLSPDPSRYGRMGQTWSGAFVAYMEYIVKHEVYQGMPDAVTEDGLIQWEAPSNRKSGKYQETHARRLAWWRNKAMEIGIPPGTSQWISRVAKAIHPTGTKPCKRCGLVLELRYAYPSANLLTRVSRLPYLSSEFELSPLEHITSLVSRLYESYGANLLDDLPRLLAMSSLSIPKIRNDVDDWLSWIEDTYIPLEPMLLSPGAMSNAPDRLDGFHSFNRCCRNTADRGRHSSNLRLYVTDRRVFEHWCDGDWIAADRMMGITRTLFQRERCIYGHDGPCSADHIGPISLGFCHRPEFQALCTACNSSKNNRMSFQDVAYLRSIEQSGESVISWYAKNAWDLRKDSVVDAETALRLSKLLRDNRQNAIHLLSLIADEGHFVFLSGFLGLAYADWNVEFVNMRVESGRTLFDKVIRSPRNTRYVQLQKARRVRIGFESLFAYFEKDGRNAYLVSDLWIDQGVESVKLALKKSSSEIIGLNAAFERALGNEELKASDQFLYQVIDQLPAEEPDYFREARHHLVDTLNHVAKVLSDKWDDERYVRSSLDFPVGEI